MNILYLPPNTSMHTKFNYKTITNSLWASPSYDYPREVIDSIQNWLEFVIDISRFKTLVTEIDLSSNNKFYIYEESDIDWLLYCEPHRMTRREPRNGDIVKVSIENVQYRAMIQIPSIEHICKHTAYKILVKAVILSN